MTVVGVMNAMNVLVNLLQWISEHVRGAVLIFQVEVTPIAMNVQKKSTFVSGVAKNLSRWHF
jgi:hypothetical protein